MVLTGQTIDISLLFHFIFWEPVYYATGNHLSYEGKLGFPSEEDEGEGYFMGFGEDVDDELTFKVLTNDTNKVIY